MLSVQVHDRKARRSLNNLEKEQYPFALARALTLTAKSGQRAGRIATKRKFKLHTKFVTRNIRIIPAKKNDIKRFNKADAAVFTDKRITDFMVQHEPGALRRPITSKKIAVPSTSLKRQGFRTAGGRVKKKFQPRTLLKGISKTGMSQGRKRTKSKVNKAFVIKAKDGTSLIVRRVGDKAYPLQLLYTFKKTVTIKQRWGLERIVKMAFGRMFPRHFNRSMAQAVRTAR